MTLDALLATLNEIRSRVDGGRKVFFYDFHAKRSSIEITPASPVPGTELEIEIDNATVPQTKQDRIHLW
jgi:hypothetical protein